MIKEWFLLFLLVLQRGRSNKIYCLTQKHISLERNWQMSLLSNQRRKGEKKINLKQVYWNTIQDDDFENILYRSGLNKTRFFLNVSTYGIQRMCCADLPCMVRFSNNVICSSISCCETNLTESMMIRVLSKRKRLVRSFRVDCAKSNL